MKHLAFSLTMGAGLFLASCGSKDDTGPDDTDDTEVEQVFAPSEGAYEGTNEVLEDNCDFPEDDSGAPLDESGRDHRQVDRARACAVSIDRRPSGTSPTPSSCGGVRQGTCRAIRRPRTGRSRRSESPP